jgi:4-amino-4-deoxy-L-arabinose transferase-like glycosyltransferase
MHRSPIRFRLILGAVVALAVAPYFVGLDRSSLWDSNEAFYAETPREMIEAGDLVNPQFNYQPRFNKPPLSYWVVVALYKAFGVSVTVERLAIALGGLAMILVAFLLGREVYGFDAGLVAAAALAANPRFLMFSRRILIDVYLAMFMGFVLLFLVLAEKQPSRRRLYLPAMYLSLALAVMTKGPVAVALAGAVYGLYVFAFRGSPIRPRNMMVGVGVLIVAAIVVPWYAAVYSQHGSAHIVAFLLQDNLSRFAQPVWGPARGPFFYLPVILGDLFPWSLFLTTALLSIVANALRRSRFSVSSVLSSVRKGLTRRRHSHPDGEGETESSGRSAALLGIWIVVIVVFFSISRSKEDLYILPIYPAACAIVGGVLAPLFDAGARRKYELPALVVAGTLITLAGGILLYGWRSGGALSELAGCFAIGLIALAGGLVVIGATWLGKTRSAVVGLILTIAAANWVFVIRVLPDYERYKPVWSLCDDIRREAGDEALVGYYRFTAPSMVFYLRRRIFEYYEPAEIIAALSSNRDVYCVLSREDYDDIERSLRVPTYVLASRPRFQVKLRGILERTEFSQVLLVTNRTDRTGRYTGPKDR